MKHINKIVAALIIGSGLAGTAYLVQARDAGYNDAEAVTQATVDITNALQIARQHVPGTVVGAEFEQEDGKMLWEVEVLAEDHQVFDLEIDAMTGELLDKAVDQADKGDDDDSDTGDRDRDES